MFAACWFLEGTLSDEFSIILVMFWGRFAFCGVFALLLIYGNCGASIEFIWINFLVLDQECSVVSLISLRFEAVLKGGDIKASFPVGCAFLLKVTGLTVNFI